MCIVSLSLKVEKRSTNKTYKDLFYRNNTVITLTLVFTLGTTSRFCGVTLYTNMTLTHGQLASTK